VEWSERSRLARPAKALAQAPVTDHKTPHNLHPSCLHHTRPDGRSAILHMMTFLWPRMVTTIPSIAPRRWRSTSLSASESLVTLVYTMSTYSRGLEWMNSFPSSSRLLVGGKLYRGDWTSRATDGWLCNYANRIASIPQLLDQHVARPLQSLWD
jgi:hypothetical protein